MAAAWADQKTSFPNTIQERNRGCGQGFAEQTCNHQVLKELLKHGTSPYTRETQDRLG
jgi:hypothetical protein